MTYAIVETGGKQLRVEPGRFYDVERLSVEESEQVDLNQVLLIQHEGDVTIGQPYVEGGAVKATVLQHLRGRKIIVYKMRPKKKTRKKRGHRQELTRLMIEAISLKGSVLAARPEDEVEPPLAVQAEVSEISVPVDEIGAEDSAVDETVEVTATASVVEEASEVSADAASEIIEEAPVEAVEASDELRTAVTDTQDPGEEGGDLPNTEAESEEEIES